MRAVRYGSSVMGPKGLHLPALGNRIHGFQNPVDVLGGVEWPQTEAHCTLRTGAQILMDQGCSGNSAFKFWFPEIDNMGNSLVPCRERERCAFDDETRDLAV